MKNHIDIALSFAHYPQMLARVLSWIVTIQVSGSGVRC
jgi:hypothetical protein